LPNGPATAGERKAEEIAPSREETPARANAATSPEEILVSCACISPDLLDRFENERSSWGSFFHFASSLSLSLSALFFITELPRRSRDGR